MKPTALLAAGFAAALILFGPVRAQMTSPSELHSALHLTADQEAAWKAYQQGIAPDPTARSRQRATQMLMPNLPTPRRVDLINAQMQADMDAVRREGEAVKTFYEALTPPQQRVFDNETAPRPPSEDGPPRTDLCKPALA